MLGIISKIFGGSKSEKDVKKITPIVQKINSFYQQYQTISNDELRGKTQEFKKRIQDHIAPVDAKIADLNHKANELPAAALAEKEAIYKQVDALKKDRDQEIEVALESI